MLRFLSAGESHGQALVVTIDGMPAGLQLDIDALNAQLRRRQGGYGRGRRMAIESDRAEILAGVRHSRTTGAPIALLIRNRVSAMPVPPHARPLLQPPVRDDGAVEETLGLENRDIRGRTRRIDERGETLRNAISIRHTTLRQG